MMALFKKYRSYLIAETEAMDPGSRWIAVGSYALPWFIPIIVGMVICYGLNLDELGRLVVMGPLGLIGVGGTTYAAGAITYYGIRSDVRRVREAPVDRGSPHD